MMRSLRIFLAVAAAGFLALIPFAPAALAHAEYLSSVPAPYELYFGTAPTHVEVTLSEAVQNGSASIRVTNQAGARVDSGPTVLSTSDPRTFSVATPGLTPDVYTATWGATSADDGHFSVGTFYFMIRNPDGSLPGQFPQGSGAVGQPVSPVEVALEALAFLGFAMAFGTLMLVALIWRPARADLSSDGATTAREGEGVLVRFARLGAALFAAAVAGLWGLAAARLETFAASALVAPYLLSLSLRIAFGVGIVVTATFLLRRSAPHDSTSPREPVLVAAVALGFAAILTDGFVTHSASLQDWWPLAPLMDATHLYGVALWVGGLLGIVRVRRVLAGKAPPEFARLVLAAFSRFAIIALGLAVLAGVFLAILLVGSLDGLVSSGYGSVVLAKAALLAPMVLLGAMNHRALSRVGSDTREAPTLVAAGRRVRAEAILGATILVLAGLLTTMSPPALAPANANFTLNATSDGLYAILQVFPYPETPGNYTFSLSVWLASNGSAFVGLAANRNNTLALSLAGASGSPILVSLEGPHGLNHFAAVSDAMHRPGTWQVDAHLVRTNGSAVDFLYAIPLHG